MHPLVQRQIYCSEDFKRVSPLKKPDGEKYDRVTITLPPKLFQSVKERCKDTNQSVSTVISELLSTWLEGTLPTQPPDTMHIDTHQYISESKTRLDKLENQIKTISEDIKKLMHTDAHQYDPCFSAPEITPTTHPGDEHDRPLEPVGMIPCENTETIQPEKQVALMMAPDEKIELNDEQFEALKIRIGELKGIKIYSEIASILNLSSGGKVSDIVNHGKRYPVSSKGYYSLLL